MKKSLLVLSTILMSATVYSFDLTPKFPNSYSLKYFHNFGTIDGFVQIPKGGKAGTSTDRRPEFNELGIKNISYPELSLTAKWDKFNMYFATKYKTFKGSATLKSDLITHDLPLKKGDKIDSKHRYIFYSLGFGYDFNIMENLTLTPKAEFSIFDFSYKFSAHGLITNINNDERKFGAGSLRIGGTAKYDFNKDFSLVLDVMGHIPYDSIKSSLETSLVASYNLFRQGNNEVNVLAGIGYDMFKYKDTQKEMQNFMYSKTKPIYKLGLELKF